MTDARNSTPTEDRIEVRLTDPLAREFRSCLEFAGAVIRSALLEHGQPPLMRMQVSCPSSSLCPPNFVAFLLPGLHCREPSPQWN